jgi:anti-sigma regulatory factor (Ser/Thr protein kinase)
VEASDVFRHIALFYHNMAEYQTAITDFVRAGLTRREPVLLAVPHADSVWPNLVAEASLMTVADMTDLGRNPARIIPAVRTFADRHLGRRVRVVSESIWHGRSLAEICEGARNEALVDRALTGVAATIVCPYSAVDLPEPVLADAACLHQWQFGAGVGAVVPSTEYAGPDATPTGCRLPLPIPPADAEVIEYRSDLRAVRAMVTRAGQRAGLQASRVTDLVLAVSEVAANTLRHTRAGGIALAWQAGDEMLCQVSDSGYIADPLAGLRRPSPDKPGGQGLWLVNQVCDLVELRTTEAGTAVRLHMRIRRP